MAQAQNSQRRITFIKESVFNTTPSTPSMQTLEVVDFDGELTAESLVSKSINSNRQASKARRGSKSTEGKVVFELTPDNYDWLFEAVCQDTFDTNVLKVGSTQTSYSIEEAFLDLDLQRVFTGVVFDKLTMNVTTDDYVTPEVTFIGAAVTDLSATSLDDTPTAVAEKPRFFHEGGTFKEGGSSVGFLTTINLEITNNVAGNKALGTAGFRNITSGRFMLSGDVTGTFESATLYNKFINNTDSSIEFTLTEGTETLTFKISQLNYTEGKIDGSGDGPCTVSMKFNASFHAGDATTLTITRSANE